MENNHTYHNSEQDRRITKLENDFGIICQNYNHEIGKIQVDISAIKTNQKYLIWFMLIMLSGIVGLFFK